MQTPLLTPDQGHQNLKGGLWSPSPSHVQPGLTAVATGPRGVCYRHFLFLFGILMCSFLMCLCQPCKSFSESEWMCTHTQIRMSLL